MEKAVEIGGAYIKPSMLSNLGAMHCMRFDRTGLMDDLNRAANVACMAVDTTAQYHPDRAPSGTHMFLGSYPAEGSTRSVRPGSTDPGELLWPEGGKGK